MGATFWSEFYSELCSRLSEQESLDLWLDSFSCIYSSSSHLPFDLATTTFAAQMSGTMPAKHDERRRVLQIPVPAFQQWIAVVFHYVAKCGASYPATPAALAGLGLGRPMISGGLIQGATLVTLTTPLVCLRDALRRFVPMDSSVLDFISFSKFAPLPSPSSPRNPDQDAGPSPTI